MTDFFPLLLLLQRGRPSRRHFLCLHIRVGGISAFAVVAVTFLVVVAIVAVAVFVVDIVFVLVVAAVPVVVAAHIIAFPPDAVDVAHHFLLNTRIIGGLVRFPRLPLLMLLGEVVAP